MAKPIVIERGLQAAFGVAMANFLAAQQLNPGLMQAAMAIQSDGAYEKLGFIGAMPGVQEWLGELNAKEWEDYDFTVKNKDWVTAVPVNQNDMDDDQMGVINMIPQLLVKRLLAHPEKLIINLLTGGTSGLAYDSVAFFSNASGVRTIDNLLAGTGTTLAQLRADLVAARVAMAKFTDDQGETLNIKGNLIICPVGLEDSFNTLVNSNSDPTASGVDTFNPFKGKVQVIGDARLDASDANDWYLLATNEIMKPLVMSFRQSAVPMMERTPNTKTWQFSANYRGNGAYGIPHLAVKTVNS